MIITTIQFYTTLAQISPTNLNVSLGTLPQITNITQVLHVHKHYKTKFTKGEDKACHVYHPSMFMTMVSSLPLWHQVPKRRGPATATNCHPCHNHHHHLAHPKECWQLARPHLPPHRSPHVLPSLLQYHQLEMLQISCKDLSFSAKDCSR